MTVALVGSFGLEVHPAGAAVPTWTNACAGDANPAACERLTFLAETADARAGDAATLGTKLDTLHADLTAAPATSEISGTVALSGDDQERLDLAWYGIWLLAGLLVVLLFAPMFVRAFRFWS